jgi:RHS repeat-associated protein
VGATGEAVAVKSAVPSLREPMRRPLTRTIARVLILVLLAGLLPADARASAPASPGALASRALPELAAAAAPSTNEVLVCVVVVIAEPVWLTKSAFGELLAHTGSDPQPYAFTGEPLDPNSGFQYHRARWMDPRVGQFVGMDPWEGNRYDPASLHRYLYAAADPLNRVDPTGRFFSSADVMGALSSLQTLAAIALPQIGAALEALAPLYFATLKVVFWADVALTVAGAAATVGGVILDGMASRLEATNTTFPAGSGPRGLEIGRVAGQNLADNFPKIDDFEFDQGVATSIKSTTQVRSQAQLVKLIAGYAGELDTIDRDLRGYDSMGRAVVIPASAVKVRQLLIAVPPLEPQIARGLSGQLAQVARIMGVNIRLVQLRGLKP